MRINETNVDIKLKKYQSKQKIHQNKNFFENEDRQLVQNIFVQFF